MKITFLFMITFFVMSMTSQSQDLSSHRWNDRLVLMLTDDTTNSTYQDQIEELYSDRKGLDDRKLVIYTILPDKYKRDDMKKQGWVESGQLYSDYKTSENPFEILLIGLDGGIKLRQRKFLSNEDLFGRIDQMPMRRSELKRRGKNCY